jgi:F-type H+-transporting ATPase subunit b
MTTDEVDHGSHSLDFIAKVINFIVLFGGLTFVLYKPVRKFLGERREAIKDSIHKARDMKKQAETELSEVSQRLVTIKVEVEKIRSDAEKEGLEEKKQIISAARKEVERLKNLTSEEISFLTNTAVKELTEYTAGVAVSQAAERIKERLTPKIHAGLIDRSIERLDKINEESQAE